MRKVDIHYSMSKLARRHSIAMANKGYIFHTREPVLVLPEGRQVVDVGRERGRDRRHDRRAAEAFMSPPRTGEHPQQWIPQAAIGTYRDANGYLWVTVFFYG